LAHLRNLLQNNNMKAMAAFDSLRPALVRLAPEAVPPLADAVLTLRFEAALATVLQAARELPAEAAVSAADCELAGDDMEQRTLRDALAHLRDLLQNNNMKAMAQFESLRPALARMAPGAVAPLADAVATLRFEAAAALVEQIAGNL
jgi:uncharacterized protein YbjQ (UPF0145 family)